MLSICVACSGSDDENTPTEENDSEMEAIGLTPGDEIDLGLSVRWASRNIGANKPEEFGGRFFWGDPFGNVEKNAAGTVNGDNYQGESIISTQYDAAHVQWGKGWRIPTMQEQLELAKCSVESITYKNVKGVLVTGPNGNKIFLPCAKEAVWNGANFTYRKGGYYWSGVKIKSSLYRMSFFEDSNYMMPGDAISVSAKCSIRAVKE